MARAAVTGSLALAMGEAVARLVAFGTTVFLARTLGPESYGVMAVAAGVMLYLSQIADSGVELGGLTDAAAGPARVNEIASSVLSHRLRVAAALLVVVVPAGYWLLPQPDGLVLAVYALGLPAVALSVRWVYVGLQRSTPVAVSRVLGDVVTAALTLAFVRGPATVLAAPLAVVLGGLAAAVLLLRGLPRLGVHLRRAHDAARVRAMLHRGRRLVLFTLLGLVLYNIDLLMLRFLGGEEAAGHYAAAYVLISFCANLMIAYAHTVLPALAGGAPPDAATAATYGSALVTACAVTMPVAVGGALIAPLVIHLLFGDAYAAAAVALQALVLAVPLGAMREIAVAALIARQCEDALLRVNIVATVVNVSLNLFLIPRYGLVGAAWATVASEVVRLGVALVTARQVIPGTLPMVPLLKCLLAGGGMALAVSGLGLRGSLLAVAVGGVVYPGLLVVLGVVSVSAGPRVRISG